MSTSRVVRALFVTDDFEACASWIERMRETIALNAAVVPTIAEAMLHLAQEPVDVIVAAGALAERSGDDALTELVQRHPSVPVIVASRDDIASLDAMMLRAIRDADLGRSLRSAHDELQGVLAASDRHSQLLANAPALIWSTDESLVVRDVEGSGARAEVAGTRVADWDPLASDLDRSLVVTAHRRALAGSRMTVRATWLGAMRYITVAPVVADGRVVGTAGAALSIAGDDAVPAPPPAARDALTDVLTRDVFEGRVDAALREAAGTHERVAVLFIDVDRFKSVNDLAGHAAGDAILRTIAERLHRALGESDALARFSADEFVILCRGLDDPAQGDAIAKAVLATFAPPFLYGEHEFHLTASVGVSFAPDDADRAPQLIANAEAALFDAKRWGRNVSRRFARALVGTPSERHLLQRELLRAVELDQLELFYQPVYDVRSGAVASVEALLRWHHPTLGTIVPDRFIPMAEESGLIDRIGEWVISRVCEQIRAWRDAGLETRVSLNVSARQLDRLMLHRFIGDAIAANGIPPSLLEIEVTETSILRDVYGATQLLQRLRDMGLRVAIDDFGAGFTSLAFLRDFPIDDLKIDRSFVRDVATGRFDGAVVRAVVTLAQSLGVRTVAEGVEDVAQMDALRELRCDAVQGFLFCAPLPAAQCEPMLRVSAGAGMRGA